MHSNIKNSDSSHDPDPDTGYMNYPLNPGYGGGTFRRRIRLTGRGGYVLAELEDCNHGFTVALHHDGKVVTNINAEAKRIPLTTCGDAVKPILKLIGVDLQTSPRELNTIANPLANCTHILDLTILAIAHVRRDETVTQYDVEIADECNGDALLTVHRDEQLVHHWQASHFAITQPENLEGKTLFRGFAEWASTLFSDNKQEAAFILQKGYFVAQARRYDIPKLAGEPATHHKEMQGNCYSYSAGIVENAFRTKGTVRDFSDQPEQLLKFK